MVKGLTRFSQRGHCEWPLNFFTFVTFKSVNFGTFSEALLFISYYDLVHNSGAAARIHVPVVFSIRDDVINTENSTIKQRYIMTTQEIRTVC